MKSKNGKPGNNPYTLSFGRIPFQQISRSLQTSDIIEDFTSEMPSTQAYMITGVRGSGKTVAMTTIAEEMAADKDWIVIELNPSRDMLQSLASKLYALPELHRFFVKARLDFSAFGLGVSIEGAAPVTDIESVLDLMLRKISEKKKKLLLTVDEAVNNENMRIFSSVFQILIRAGHPVFVIMTGLYENIRNLQDDKSLTFLYRTPRIALEPLNIIAIRNSYQKVFRLNEEDAGNMAQLTRGFPFAFQVLGYLCWKNPDSSSEAILEQYDQYLSEYVYDKIWSELSELDKKVISAVPEDSGIQVKKLRELLNMSSELFSVYRDRLKKNGLLDVSTYGRVSQALPRFGLYAQTRMS